MAKRGRKPPARATSAAHQAVGPPYLSSRSPPLLRDTRPLGRISASLEGYAPPRANFRLARGLRSPSGEPPPRSRATRPLGRISASLEGYAPPSGEYPLRSRPPRARGPRAHSLDQSIKSSGTTRAPRSKANPHHASALTPLGNLISMLFHQPAQCGHPQHFAGTMRQGRCQLCDTVPPTPVRPPHHTPRGRVAEPSKEVRKPTPQSCKMMP
jgi:hypothetical protein